MIQNVKNRDSLSAILFTEDENRKMDKKKFRLSCGYLVKNFSYFFRYEQKSGVLIRGDPFKNFFCFFRYEQKNGFLTNKKISLYIYMHFYKKIKKQKKIGSPNKNKNTSKKNKKK